MDKLTLSSLHDNGTLAVAKLQKTATGWNIHEAGFYSGECEPNGSKKLLSYLSHNTLTYPHNLPNFLEYLWGSLDNESISQAKAQEKINEISDWIAQTNKSTPQWPGFNCSE